MVLMSRNTDMDDSMPQIVPSAGFTPPCDYSNFAENFDLSLLPGGDLALSPSTLFYTQSPPPPTVDIKPKIYTTFYADTTLETDEKDEIDLGPDFQKLLPQSAQNKKQNLYPPSPTCGIYLEVPSSKSFHPNSPIGALSPYSPQGLLSPNEQFSVYPPTDQSNFYPNSPDISLYQSSNSVYARSPRDDFIHAQFIKKENTFQNSPLHTYSPYHVKEEAFLSPCGTLSPPSPNYSNHSSPAPRNLTQIENNDVFELLENTLLDKQVKQESTVDFGSLLQTFTTGSPVTFAQNPQTLTNDKSTPQDHQLLREVLRDTSFQRKFNIKPIDFGFIGAQIKMEEPDENSQKELINSCNDQLTRENIEPVLNLAIEQMRKDVDTTCAALSISSDPSQWTSANVLSWLQWTNREFGLPALAPEQWDMTGTSFVNLTEDDFTKRAPQGGSILYAQLEIWKAACLDEEMTMNWLPETASSNASSGGDVSEEEEEEAPPKPLEAKPTTSRASGGSHIHLWQFLKELLASPQLHGSCIRWLDRTSGIFKIEDSVKVARLWGKRKNRPAMNYDKLSRSIRQYYKKGIMKKTERSQRLVYQFCHPYCL